MFDRVVCFAPRTPNPAHNETFHLFENFGGRCVFHPLGDRDLHTRQGVVPGAKSFAESSLVTVVRL